MTKTPQQIKNEVEKEIKRAKQLLEENTSSRLKTYWALEIDKLNAKLSILTEYDKSIKEMIEDWKRNSILKYDDDCPYCQRHISNTIIQAKELLSKIGDNSEVTK